MIYTIVTRSVELYPTISIIFNQTYCYRIFANWPLIWPKKKTSKKWLRLATDFGNVMAHLAKRSMGISMVGSPWKPQKPAES